MAHFYMSRASLVLKPALARLISIRIRNIAVSGRCQEHTGSHNEYTDACPELHDPKPNANAVKLYRLFQSRDRFISSDR